MKLIPFVLVALTLAGCAVAQVTYTKQGAPAAQLEQDKRECLYEAQKAVPWRKLGDYTAQEEVEIACLISRGYSKS